jgi:prepilin-type N-terminal cleavage/methylation domain-containing protein
MFTKTKNRGFTLPELLVGAGLFVVLMTASLLVGVGLYKSRAKVNLQNELYNESRVALERIVREVRVNSIDYYEYFSQNPEYDARKQTPTTGGGFGYGSNPGMYEMFFYYIPNSGDADNDVTLSTFSWNESDRSEDINMGYFHTNANNTATDDDEDKTSLAQSEQNELYLLSSDFLTKTIFRLKNNRIEILKMSLLDSASDNDTTPDYWEIHTDFPNTGDQDESFLPITPENIEITDFKVYIVPLDDPFKSFAESMSGGYQPHVQPSVILSLSAKVESEKAKGFFGENPEVHLQTMVSSRVYQNITFPRPPL